MFRLEGQNLGKTVFQPPFAALQDPFQRTQQQRAVLRVPDPHLVHAKLLRGGVDPASQQRPGPPRPEAESQIQVPSVGQILEILRRLLREDGLFHSLRRKDPSGQNARQT